MAKSVLAFPKGRAAGHLKPVGTGSHARELALERVSRPVEALDSREAHSGLTAVLQDAHRPFSVHPGQMDCATGCATEFALSGVSKRQSAFSGKGKAR